MATNQASLQSPGSLPGGGFGAEDLGHQIKKERMKNKLFMSCTVALGLSALSAHAWSVSGVVRCASGRPDVGATLCIPALGLTTTTDSSGGYSIELPDVAFRGKICLDTSTGTVGLSVKGNGCQNFSVDDANMFVIVNFTVTGTACSCVIPAACWMTGGGTIDDTSGDVLYSYGGVVYPGCSPRAAGGGNWNVVNHAVGLHFKGLDIIVDRCSGDPTSSPPVNVNVIDFHGVGIVVGIEGNNTPLTAVTFSGHVEDHAESGAGADILQLTVDGFGDLTFGPETVSTGNLQIHTSGCAKY